MMTLSLTMLIPQTRRMTWVRMELTESEAEEDKSSPFFRLNFFSPFL